MYNYIIAFVVRFKKNNLFANSYIIDTDKYHTGRMLNCVFKVMMAQI